MARHVRAPAADRRTRTVVGVSVVLLLAGSSAFGVALVRSTAAGDGTAGTPQHPVAAKTEQPNQREQAVRPVDWVAVLARLDARRSQAFAAGDVDALERVYTDGSQVLRRDRRLLRRYLDRGLRVSGLRMRVVDLRLLETGASRAVLRVRDRVAAGRVEDDTGATRPLREDTWSRHRIVLQRGDDGWRISDLTRLG